MLFFADSGERVIVQALLMGSVAAVITALLLLLALLDDPFSGSVGSLRPTVMERTVRKFDQELEVVDVQLSIPCDDNGVAH